MRRPVFLSFLLLHLLACGEKKATTINPQKVADELTQYGQSNPETEVQIETPFSNMKIKLYNDTPLHRANFIKNIKEGIYDDAEFYRVYRQFMIQGGIYPKELQYTVPAEFNRKSWASRAAPTIGGSGGRASRSKHMIHLSNQGLRSAYRLSGSGLKPASRLDLSPELANSRDGLAGRHARPLHE